jgi:hypothetical protein
MVEHVSPQEVKNNAEDYVVYVEDRYHMKYESKYEIGSVEVDFGKIVGIYADSLVCTTVDNKRIDISEEKKGIFLEKISEAIQFMGSKVEIC